MSPWQEAIKANRISPSKSNCLMLSASLKCLLIFHLHISPLILFLQGGLYVFEMFDIQSGGISLVLIALLESIAIGWVYGKKNSFYCVNKIHDWLLIHAKTCYLL